MIKVFAGEDSFESYKIAKNEATKLAENKKLNLKIINSDELNSVDVFLQEIESIGMFAQESVIFAKRLLDNKKLSEFLETHFDRLDKYHIIIWHGKKSDGRSKFVKFLKEKKILFEYNLQSPKEVLLWVQRILDEKKIKLTRDQINFMTESLEFNKALIFNELEKLDIYCTDKEARIITNEDLNKLLGFDVKGNIWKFLDAFGNKNKVTTIEEFEKLTKFESNVQMLIAMIQREINIMLQIRYANEKRIDSKALKIHPFVLNKTRKKLEKFSKMHLQKLSRKLFDLDFAIKTGKIEETIGMTLYLMKI